MSPDEFEITIKSIDSAGHMAVMGILGYQLGSSFQQQLSFAFEFDPSQLAELVNIIKANNK